MDSDARPAREILKRHSERVCHQRSAAKTSASPPIVQNGADGNAVDTATRAIRTIAAVHAPAATTS